MSKGLQIAIGGALVALLLGWYGASRVGDTSSAYYQTLEEFQAVAEPGRAVRVHGYVADGSIERDGDGRQGDLGGQDVTVRPFSVEIAPELGQHGVMPRAVVDGAVAHREEMMLRSRCRRTAAAVMTSTQMSANATVTEMEMYDAIAAPVIAPNTPKPAVGCDPISRLPT